MIFDPLSSRRFACDTWIPPPVNMDRLSCHLAESCARTAESSHPVRVLELSLRALVLELTELSSYPQMHRWPVPSIQLGIGLFSRGRHPR